MTTARRELAKIETVGTALFAAALVCIIIYALDTAGHGQDRALWGGFALANLLAWGTIRAIVELVNLYDRARRTRQRR